MKTFWIGRDSLNYDDVPNGERYAVLENGDAEMNQGIWDAVLMMCPEDFEVITGTRLEPGEKRPFVLVEVHS